MKHILLSIVAILALTTTQAQKVDQVKLTGKVLDNLSNQPLEYATVVAKNTKDNKVYGGITTTKGTFEVKVPAGVYNISIEFISFDSQKFNNRSITKNTDLGIIKLKESSAVLDEITIVAEKTTVDIRLDKKIYNIGKDLSVRGGNASDVLGNVPSVQVDVEGNVSLRGNGNVTIFIDGRPSALVGMNGAEALRQIPAEAIERVEVITSPSARYDAEGTGGILNIILRKNKVVGFNGSVQLDLGHPDRYGSALNANYRTEKWNLFTNTGWRYNGTPGNSFTDSQFFSPNAQNARVVETRRFGRLGRSLFTSFGAEYYINDNSSLIGNIVYNAGNDDDINRNVIDRFNATGGINESTVRTENEGEDENRVQFTIDYVNNFDGKGRKLTINAQYSTEVQDINNNITEFDTTNGNNILNDLELVIEDQDETRGLLQVDYVHPVGETIQYEAGYRGNYRDIFNQFYLAERLVFPNGPLVPDVGLNNSFNYQELVNAAYFQYGQEFNKVSLLAGLRFEHTEVDILNQTSADTDSKSYSNLFPTINVGIEFNDTESMTVGYNRRIRRPRGRFLNPFPSRSSESNIFSGNVDLNPVISDVFEIGYLKKWEKFTLNTSIYYNTSADNWEFIQQDTGDLTDNGDPIIRRFPVNLSQRERMGFEFTLNYKPIKAWNINADFNLFNVQTTGEFGGQDFGFDNTAYFVRLNQKITFFKELDVQVNMNYRGPNRNAQSTREGIFSTNLAASKDLFKKKATISFNVSDLFNSRKRRSTAFVPGAFEQYGEFQWRERQIRMSFIYRFNQKKKPNRRGGRDGDDFQEYGGTAK
ncbi:MAG: TonB-dependent receptor [Flavobacteriaceae bacterium]|nr:TonB-dependent receptor [Flavobacteriaceae bacterium]|tara:strand:+ start:75093 stop:77543 length:2451 start_codon:yes stop_codon:yes gene_type:complete